MLGTGRSRGPARLVIVSEAVTRALLSARLVPRIRSDLLGSACVQQGVAATCSAPLAAVNMLRLLGVWRRQHKHSARTVQAQRARAASPAEQRKSTVLERACHGQDSCLEYPCVHSCAVRHD